MIDKICLGAVKLGVPDYGFSNREVAEDFDPQIFLQQCWDIGIRAVDTSPRYGNSEKTIGDFIKRTNFKFEVSTKIDELTKNADFGLLQESVQRSLERLGIIKINVLYLHQNELEIIANQNIQKSLIRLKELGFTKKIGVSLYSLEECAYAMAANVFDVIQIPINAFETRFYDFLKNNENVEMVARSILLQGVMAHQQDLSHRIKFAPDIQQYLIRLDEVAHELGMTALELAIAFVFNLRGVSQFIFGSTNIENLKKNISLSKTVLPPRIMKKVYDIGLESKVWTNPRNWN